ncbi:MAG: VOC family protein [Pseudomonadota bacterium]
MAIRAIDHFVLTVTDIEATVEFYTRHLGLGVQRFVPAGGGAVRVALVCGAQKINLHAAGAEFRPHAAHPTRGAGDFCLLTDEPVAALAARLAAGGVTVEDGPVARSGAQGPLSSIYVRDPDANLVEIANQIEA